MKNKKTTIRTVYKLNTYGDFAEINVTTDRKRVINSICKLLAKNGINQTTEITTEKRTTTAIRELKKEGKII